MPSSWITGSPFDLQTSTISALRSTPEHLVSGFEQDLEHLAPPAPDVEHLAASVRGGKNVR